MPRPVITAEELRAMVHYDPETGIFVWKPRPDLSKTWNTRYSGKVCGYDWTLPDGRQYRSIRIHDWPFLGHVLAHLYMIGGWPDYHIDHRDNDGLNNRWNNLRAATKKQNAANSKRCVKNTSGLKGASFCKHNQRWRADIVHNGRQLWLGYHDTKEAAHAAYMKKSMELHGDFARSS